MTNTTKPKIRRRKEARPAEIIEAGMQEFAEFGFERARLDRIATAAGVAKGTIYLYFDSKEALFLAATEAHVVRVVAESETHLETFTGPTDAILVRLLQTIYDQMAEGRAQTLMRILVSEGHRVPHLLEQYHGLVIKRATALISGILQRGVARGEVSETAILDNPQVVIAPALFFALHSMMFGNVMPLDREGFFKAHVEMMLKGVMKDDPAASQADG